MVLHVAAGVGGPQRRPAGAHRGQKLRLVGKAEETFELAGKIGAGAILNQRRGAHRTRLPRCFALRTPRGEERFERLVAEELHRVNGHRK